MHQFYVMGKHSRRRVKIGNHAVLQRPQRFYGLRGFPQHPFGLASYGDHLLSFPVPGNDGRFAYDDALAPDVHKRIGGTQVYT